MLPAAADVLLHSHLTGYT